MVLALSTLAVIGAEGLLSHIQGGMCVLCKERFQPSAMVIVAVRKYRRIDPLKVNA
ncbi:hypothetical protein SDC9_136031 [bioreactor metagenome]|uniref:Uncharacterized protein n=1 Tax=bioreactor metagenome TaxID=1076179 RepID=A0A645DI36_9ZZZZ